MTLKCPEFIAARMPSSDPPGYHLCGLEQEDGRYGSQVSKALKPTLQCPLSALKTFVTEFCRGIDLGDTNFVPHPNCFSGLRHIESRMTKFHYSQLSSLLLWSLFSDL